MQHVNDVCLDGESTEQNSLSYSGFLLKSGCGNNLVQNLPSRLQSNELAIQKTITVYYGQTIAAVVNKTNVKTHEITICQKYFKNIHRLYLFFKNLTNGTVINSKKLILLLIS